MKTGSNSVQLSLDRRSAGRERCVLRCRITHGPSGEGVDGVVRDLHKDGARLRFGSRSDVSGRIKLEIQPSGLFMWQMSFGNAAMKSGSD
jgi:hypothetical protein